MSLKAQITEDMKTAMRAKDSARLSTIRLLQAAMKQKEVDERITLDDAASAPAGSQTPTTPHPSITPSVYPATTRHPHMPSIDTHIAKRASRAPFSPAGNTHEAAQMGIKAALSQMRILTTSLTSSSWV